MARLNRICQQFRPENYKLGLSLSDDLSLIKGKVEISGFRKSRPSYRITLHQSGLKVSSAKVYKVLPKSNTKHELTVLRLIHHKKLEELRIHTKERIDSGKYILSLEYSAPVQKKTTSGVYISTWHDSEDNLSNILTTQFQTHYARTLIPCVDEPEAKATFDLTLTLFDTKETKLNCLFNTALKSSSSSDSGHKTLVYEQTPKMSTYLLALIVGEIDNKSTKSSSGVPISVYTTPNKLDQTGFALDYSKKVFDLLEGYFDEPYPLAKCDLVAIPDLDSGGMENWGLITFREDLLLFDEELSTLADKQAIALIIAHEIAHQWFGNLVTIKWWDELWLNEGFANFMEYFIVDKLNPEWNIFEDYLVSEKSTAIRLDSLPSSRPIINKVSSPHHAVEIFDEIAYQKSGSIIRMIYSTLGEDIFRKGLTDYFNKFKFSSATSNDLIACWQKLTKLNIKALVESWLCSPGLPILGISYNQSRNLIQISQSRFLSETKSKKQIDLEIHTKLNQKSSIKKLQKSFYQNNLKNKLNKPNDCLWQIPIDFVCTETLSLPKSLKPFILKKQNHSIQLPANANLPIKLNKDGQGFYVTKYSYEFLAQISQAIKLDKLSSLDILNVLLDFIALDKLGKFEPGSSSILDIISSSKNSLNANFWSLTGSFVGNIHYQLKQIDQQDLIEKFTRSLIKPALAKLKVKSGNDKDPNITSARFEVLSLAVMAKDSSVCKELTELYYNNQNDLSQIPPELRILSLYAVAKLGLEKDYDHILSIYKESHEDVSLREDLMYSLTSFEGQKFALRNIELLQDNDLARQQDILSWVSLTLSTSKASKEEVLKWLTKNGGWQWLLNNLSPAHLNYSVRVFISSSYTKRDLNSLLKFFANSDNEELNKSITEATEIAVSRIAWNKKQLPKLIEYLTSVAKS